MVALQLVVVVRVRPILLKRNPSFGSDSVVEEDVGVVVLEVDS